MTNKHADHKVVEGSISTGTSLGFEARATLVSIVDSTLQEIDPSPELALDKAKTDLSLLTKFAGGIVRGADLKVGQDRIEVAIRKAQNVDELIERILQTLGPDG